MNINTFLEWFNHYFTLFIIFPSIIALGVYLTVKLRMAQVFKLKQAFCSLLQPQNRDIESKKTISRFQAVSAVLAGNFGTGNISGMAIALSVAGPGALVWMWIMAFFGAIIQYVSCVLGFMFRKQQVNGEYVGGPMYYLRDGMGYSQLAALFAFFTILSSLTVGNFVQVNSIILPFHEMGFNPLLGSSLLAFIIGLIILGGIKRIGLVASCIVPFKSIIYLGTALIIIFSNSEKIIPSFELMFKEAFNLSAIIGGTAGFSALKMITTGFDRGLFATDAGNGFVPIIQSNVDSTNPLTDGFMTLVTPFIVMIVCTMTGLVIIMSGAWQNPELQSTNLVIHAFNEGLSHSFGGYIVIMALILFAMTTILAWSYCGEKAFNYLFGNNKEIYFKIIYVALIPFGSLLHVKSIWILADISITLMLAVNLIGVAGLAHHVIKPSEALRLKALKMN